MKPKMGVRKVPFVLKTCQWCGGSYGAESYSPTNSIFYKDGYLPMCNDCIEGYLIENDFNWTIVDRLCQFVDIPFVPQEFERLHRDNGDSVFPLYARIFQKEEYEAFGWDEYFKEFKRLEQEGALREQLPGISDAHRRELKEKWGANYDDEALNYLENLLQGLYLTQNVTSALQQDQALKACKLSYEIDNRIRAGGEIDKLLTAYEKTIKLGDFTPKTANNSSGFGSVGELSRWLEKRGWKPNYYDDVKKDIVDESMNNIQMWNQRLYTEESGMGDEITHRLENLRIANALENQDEQSFYFDEKGPAAEELDKYENDGFDRLHINDEFLVDCEGD